MSGTSALTGFGKKISVSEPVTPGSQSGFANQTLKNRQASGTKNPIKYYKRTITVQPKGICFNFRTVTALPFLILPSSTAQKYIHACCQAFDSIKLHLVLKYIIFKPFLKTPFQGISHTLNNRSYSTRSIPSSFLKLEI